MGIDCSVCPFCNLPVPSADLQRHANNHFEEDDEASIIDYSSPQILGNDRGGIALLDVEKSINVRLKSMEGKGGELMKMLEVCLKSEKGEGTSILCGNLDHFQCAKHTDLGWGCGWRNIQMLSSHLISSREDAKDVLFGGSGFVPDIYTLQKWMEVAWERGFDAAGSDHFNRKIHGSTAWIGATECATLFRSFRIRARIVDFCSSPQCPSSSSSSSSSTVYGPMDMFVSRNSSSMTQYGTEIGSSKGELRSSMKTKWHNAIFDWVWSYFTENNYTIPYKQQHGVFCSGKPPLFLQHDGHSRSIVGIQVKPQGKGKKQCNLLLFDPAHRTEDLKISLGQNRGWQNLIKRGVHTLKESQYQVCYMDRGIASNIELEQLKILESQRFYF